VTPEEAKALQQRLRAEVVPAPPPGFAPRRFAGLDVSFSRGSDVAYAGIAVLERGAGGAFATVAEASAVATLTFPYIPGYLSFRELPALAEAWARLDPGARPDVLVFDGQGIAHPRRFGIACHGGLAFGVPSVGCAKSILVGTHGPLATERGATAPLEHRGEVVGMALRLRAGVKPVYVSPGHLMDLDTAVAVVLALDAGFREPETTRRAHRLVNRLRRDAEAADADADTR
jgi:deoxyribonuclease V